MELSSELAKDGPDKDRATGSSYAWYAWRGLCYDGATGSSYASPILIGII